MGTDGDFVSRIILSEPGSADVWTNQSIESFGRFFRMDWDTDSVCRRLLDRGPELEPYLKQFQGLRVLRPSDPVETFFSFLCTSNNHISRIKQMVGYLGRLGESIPNDWGIRLYRFPTPERLSRVSELELRQCGFGYRSPNIPKAASMLVERGSNWLESLKTVSYVEAHRELCQFPGIGPKLADCIALFGLDHGEAVPVDTHIWQAFRRLYYPELAESPLTDARYRSTTADFRLKFGELSGWAQQVLFYENMMNWRERRG